LLLLALRRTLLATLALACIALAVAWFGLTQPWVPSTSAPGGPRASAPDLRHDVEILSTRFAGRSHDNLTQLEGAAAHIEARLRAHGFAVESQRFQARGRPYRNLIVRLGPDTPEVVVVGAHYDVFGDLPGADDNASGVAGLIELARLLRGQPLPRRVELVAYANEEPPFFRTPSMGSAVHARSLRAAGKRAALMLSLECIGYFSDAPGSQSHPARLLEAAYPTTGNFIALVGFFEDGPSARRVKAAMQGASDLPVHSINAPGFVVGIDFSDHLAYANEGFVGMMVTDTAFYRNAAYHTAEDRFERLDYARMAKVVDGVRAAVVAAAAR
jgi:hypothetical protein